MPLYEYECRKCHHRFEVIQTFSARPVRKCPKCKTGTVRKLVSSPAFHFKGSGWYVTDYARKGAKDAGGESDVESKDKTEKSDKADKTGKSDKADKADKSDKADKADKSSDKGAAAKKESKKD